jgi:hypothetical protein
VITGQGDLEQILSPAFGRDVAVEEARLADRSSGATAEEYWPDMGGLDYQDTVTDFEDAGRDLLRHRRRAPADHRDDQSSAGAVPAGTLRSPALSPQHRRVDRERRCGLAENEWIGRTVAIGGNVRLAITEPCPRCVMITLPQGDLPKDSGIVRAAAQHNGVNVGVYASVLSGGTIRRGDPVTLA